METLFSGSLGGILPLVAVTGTVFALVTQIIILILLMVASAFISGSEVAYFSLTPGDLEELEHSKSKKASTVLNFPRLRKCIILNLLSKPDRLLSSILVTNNIVNIAIIILAAFISSRLFDLGNNPILSFIIEVVVITFMLLLFCEVMPKVYASRNQLRFALAMAPALTLASTLVSPLSTVLSSSSFFLRFRRKSKARDSSMNINDLSVALELTSSGIKDDKDLLKGVVRFGNISVSAVMCPRIDVTALDLNRGFKSVMEEVIESGFSRIPVYSGSFDNIRGILFVKDLLPHLGKPDTFRWQTLIRPPYMIPETKKISELLKEFQEKKIHIAIVVDEYGGTSGIVTLEDVLEEIVGDITDETDEEIPLYRETSEGKWVFDGKILLNDFYRITMTENDPFSDIRGDSETLAGLLLELLGENGRQFQVHH